MNGIISLVQQNKNFTKEVEDLVNQFNNQSEHTKLVYAETVFRKMKEYEQTIKVAGEMMIEDQKDYNDLQQQNQRLQLLVEEYKKQKGELNMDFVNSNNPTNIISPADDEIARQYIHRIMQRKGIRVEENGKMKIYAKRQ